MQNWEKKRLEMEEKIIRDKIRLSPSRPLRGRENRCKGRKKNPLIWVEGKGLLRVEDRAF